MEYNPRFHGLCALLAQLVTGCVLPDLSLIVSDDAVQTDAGVTARATSESEPQSSQAMNSNQPSIADAGTATMSPAASMTAGSDTMDSASPASSAMDGIGSNAGVLGASCQQNNDCASSSCVDHVCCGQAQCGECQKCDEHGSCTNVKFGDDDPDTCNGSSMACDGAGSCALDLGATCGTTTATECISKHCEVTGEQTAPVCCAMQCGVCQVCSGIGDQCTPVQFGTDAKTCIGTHTCSAQTCHQVDVNRLLPPSGLEQMLMSLDVIAQTFTSLSAGKLIEIRLRAFGDCRTMARLQGVTADGLPNGVDIARSTNTVSNLMFSLVPIAAGQKLAFVLDKPDCTIPLGNPNDTYAGGEALTQTNGQWQKHPGSLNFMTVYE